MNLPVTTDEDTLNPSLLEVRAVSNAYKDSPI